MKIGEIRELIRLLDETSLSEVKIETDDMKLLLKKAGSEVVSTVAASAPVQPVAASAPLPQAAAPAAPQSAAPAEQEQAAPEESGIHLITAPMVGTFYRAPSPDADPFVGKGDKVNGKTVVCIVEAMKLMNEIEAEVEGEVVDILVENGQLVEYGQPMFKIKLS